jgi:hypothetical protein
VKAPGPGGLHQCAWCGRVSVEDAWIDPVRLLDGGLGPRLLRKASHGICPACLERNFPRVAHMLAA